MITIFTTTKNFEGEFEIIQENALSNWRTLSNQIEIFIMGDSIGAKEAAIRNNAKYIKDNKISIYLNSSGKPLFMRGYRSIIHKAALNECLAAGILKLTNWSKKQPLYDCMCGSGTFLIEAAMSAFNIPPRILRADYSFLNYKDFDEILWTRIIKKSNKKINYDTIKLYGSDLVDNNIKICLESLKKLK